MFRKPRTGCYNCLAKERAEIREVTAPDPRPRFECDKELLALDAVKLRAIKLPYSERLAESPAQSPPDRIIREDVSVINRSMLQAVLELGAAPLLRARGSGTADPLLDARSHAAQSGVYTQP